MTDYTPYQEGIIRHYYRNRQAIAFQKLQDLAAELYLAETERKRESLWKRIGKALVNLEVPPKIADHILSKRSPQVLVENLKEWWEKLPKKKEERDN